MSLGLQLSEAIGDWDFSISVLIYHLASLVVAFLLALPVAWDREQLKNSPGLRTFPLVAMASCAYVLVVSSIAGNDPDATSRMLQGLATGIGFIGGGAILKDGSSLRGTATAAGIWTMGALGSAVAFRRLEIALLLAIVTYGTLRWLKPFKAHDEEES